MVKEKCLLLYKEKRKSAILDQLLKQGSVLVSALSDNLQVSAVTIRKDLTDLERQGRLYRSHGKAILINPFTANRSVNEKEKLFPEEKYSSCAACHAQRLHCHRVWHDSYRLCTMSSAQSQVHGGHVVHQGF